MRRIVLFLAVASLMLATMLVIAVGGFALTVTKLAVTLPKVIHAQYLRRLMAAANERALRSGTGPRASN